MNVHTRRSTTAEMPLARSAADTACTNGEFTSPPTSGRFRSNHADAGPGLKRSPATTRVSTPVKNGLQLRTCGGIACPASGPSDGARAPAPGGVAAASVFRNTAVHRATGLPPCASAASTVRALRPSRRTVTDDTSRSRVTGRQRSKLRRASIMSGAPPSCSSARTSNPP